jgi:hypothetical protein
VATSDTVLAIYNNLRAIVETLGGRLTTERALTLDSVSPMLGVPQYTVTYLGSDFENSVGEKPKYDNSTFMVRARFYGETMDELSQTLISTIHATKEAVNVAALNVGSLAVSKLVSRVSAVKPDVKQEAPAVVVTMNFIIRYREG